MVRSCKPAQKIVDPIDAGEDGPIVAIQMIDRGIKRVVTFRFSYFDGWTKENACAETFQLCDEVRCLRAGSRYYHSAASEWLRFDFHPVIRRFHSSCAAPCANRRSPSSLPRV